MNNRNIRKFVFIRTQKEMMHCYPDAPEDVSFLRNVHRHIFHFQINIEVFNDDRDIEFIQFKRYVEKLINKIDKNLETKSCEMLSNELAKTIIKRFPKRDLLIEVSEDGENGSRIIYEIQ